VSFKRQIANLFDFLKHSMDTNAPPGQGTPTPGDTSRPMMPLKAPRPSSNAAHILAPTSAPTARYATGDSRGKKRRSEHDAFDFVNTVQNSQELCTTHDDPAVVNWTSDDATRAIGPTMLKTLDPRAVVYQLRRNETSLLETPDHRVNFCTTDTYRAVAGGQLIKVLADKPSLDALSSTLLNLASLNNARFLHIRVEPESVEIGGQHLDQLAAMGAKSARRKADDAAATAEKASAVAESREVQFCVVCQRHGHLAQVCVMPNPTYGSIRFCPTCNTKAHDFDRCPVVKSADLNSRTFVVEATKLLILARINKPQIRSLNWSFFDLLALGCDLNYLESPATECPGWPWSNKFAKEVAAVKPGDPWLKGKVHPSEFDHKRHRLGDLPIDPFYDGKSIRDILAMRNRGELDDDRFVPKGKPAPVVDMAPPPSKKDMDRMFLQALAKYNPPDENNNYKPMAKVFIVKAEEDD
jgi:hypothetical protein